MKRYLTLLFVFAFGIFCSTLAFGADDLTREKAKEILDQVFKSQRQPTVMVFPKIQKVDSYYTSLEKAGYISIISEQKSGFKVTVNDSLKPFVIKENPTGEGTMSEIKIGDFVVKEIKGITASPSLDPSFFRRVQFNIEFQPNATGKCLDKDTLEGFQESNGQRFALFVKYDDGWRYEKLGNSVYRVVDYWPLLEGKKSEQAALIIQNKMNKESHDGWEVVTVIANMGIYNVIYKRQ